VLAWYVLWSIVFIPLTKLAFGVEASIGISYSMLKGNLGMSKNKGISLRNFVPQSELGHFLFGMSAVASIVRFVTFITLSVDICLQCVWP